MNPLTLIRLVDAVILITTAYQNHQRHEALASQTKTDIDKILDKVRAGELGVEEAASKIDDLALETINRRKRVFGSLPEPTGHS